MNSSAGSYCSDDSFSQSLGEDTSAEEDRERIARLEVAVTWIKQEVVSLLTVHSALTMID